MKLSIFLSGIRVANWLTLYQSIPNATTITDYELVIVSPYDLPPELADKENVRLIKDNGCPTRCYQLGLIHSQGDYVVWIADDGILSPGLAIDKGFDILPADNGIVCFTYYEGSNEINRQRQSVDRFWRLGAHKTLRNMKHVPDHYFLIMVGLMRRDYLMELGGWDCRFEQPGVACVDASVRWQLAGANVVLGERCQIVEHCSGVDKWGIDHAPIAQAHNQHDFPLLHRVYKRSQGHRTKINVENWSTAPDVWGRRIY
jgi:glycosyltransferase involved in cell wall biosynthesis